MSSSATGSTTTKTPKPRHDVLTSTAPQLPSPRVDVYRNLNQQCMSVKCMAYGAEMKGRVIAHTEAVTLHDVDFVIWGGTQQDAIDSGVRNVHAYARGMVAEEHWSQPEGTKLTYRLFDEEMPDTFATVNGEPVASAERLHVSVDHGMVAEGVTYE